MIKINRIAKKLLNLILIGIGLGVIFGSFLKIFTPLHLSSRSKIQLIKPGEWKNQIENSNSEDEIVKLSNKWKSLTDKHPELQSSGYLFLIDEGKYASHEAMKSFPAASSIKVPILLLALQMIDKGDLFWDEKIELTREDVAGGAGWMAYQQIGNSFPIYEIVTEMIRVSDNTATNILIRRLGGITFINNSLEKLGLNSTKLRSLLPDLAGTNSTSSLDLVKTINLGETTNILSKRSRDLFRETLSTSKTNKLIPGGILEGLEKSKIELKNIDYKLLIKGYRVYNKTGDIGISYSDIALIQMPNNKRAIAGFIVKGPFNDPRSTNLIREMSSAMIPYISSKHQAQ